MNEAEILQFEFQMRKFERKTGRVLEKMGINKTKARNIQFSTQPSGNACSSRSAIAAINVARLQPAIISARNAKVPILAITEKQIQEIPDGRQQVIMPH